MNWLYTFLDKKFKLKRVPPFLWPLLGPILAIYFFYRFIRFILILIFEIIMWITGFKHCDFCNKWRWAHNEMKVLEEYLRHPNGQIKRDENHEAMTETLLKCVGCIVADKLTED